MIFMKQSYREYNGLLFCHLEFISWFFNCLKEMLKQVQHDIFGSSDYSKEILKQVQDDGKS